MFEKYLTSEKGLSSTSANYIANVAKESIEEYEQRLAKLPLYSVYFNLLDAPEDQKKCITHGLTDTELQEVYSILKKIAKAKSLCAWVREAIKTKDKMLKLLRCMSYTQWAAEQGIELPKYEASSETYDHDATLTIAEKADALVAETFAAVYGKFVHKNGGFNNARKAYYEAVQNPTTLKGEGHDTTIMTSEPTVSKEVLEETYMELQNIWRGYEAQSNKFKYDEEQAVAKFEENRKATESQAYKNYNAKIQEIQKDFEVWKQTEETRIASLKIAIPNCLEDIFVEMQNLGKKNVD